MNQELEEYLALLVEGQIQAQDTLYKLVKLLQSITKNLETISKGFRRDE